MQCLSRRSFCLAILSVFLCDLIVCISIHLLGRSSDQETHDSDLYKASTNDTLDLCFARLVILPFLAGVAWVAYKKTAATSPLQQLQQQEELSSMVAPNGNGSVNSFQDLSRPLRPNDAAGDASSFASSDQSSVQRSAKASFEMQRDHMLFMKQAGKRRDLVMTFLFSICTAMSMYNGLKCISFHYDPRLLAIQGALQTMVMLIINVEYFMLRGLLKRLTAEEGELIPHIHLHPLFFETGLKCHNCDICSERTKGPHYIAYRCRTCDFDLCPRCYKQKDKPSAKGHGARSIRRDGEQITTWSYFKRIVELAVDFWKTLAIAVICLVIQQGLQIWAPNVQGSIFDGIISYLKDPASDGGRKAFEKAMITYLVVNVLQGAFSGLKALAQELVMRRIACTVRLKLFTSVIRMDISFFDAMHTGQITSRLTNDSSQMVQPLGTLMNDLLANLLLLVGGMFMAFHTSWKLSVLALTIVPPITYCYRAYANWARKVNRSIYCALGEANSTATDSIANIRTVRGFSTEAHEVEKYADSINTALSHGIKNAYVGASVTAFSSYMNLGTAVLILWYGGSLVCDTNGELMSIGKLITFQLYWNMMNSAFISLGNVFNDLIRSSSAAERVFSIIDARPEVNPDEGEVVTREDIKGHLKLIGLQFRYKTRPENIVLKGVDLDMPPCTTTALVGKSGGGKSTLVHLLMRFYEPTEGTMLLDGKDMKTLSSTSVRQCCGFVAQDTQLFACSIEENLAYGLGRPHTREEVVAACTAANAHEFIMDMEEGYETRAGEKGILLSGGQRQRLAIARCFLRRPKLLLLDEATSALDAENEGIVQGALDSLLVELSCTVVLIAHRLSTVINATQIAVVHKGTIVERGNHKELVANPGGVYAQLVNRQMARDASSLMENKANGKHVKSAPGKGTEIDDLIEEMEQAGSLNLEQVSEIPNES